MRIKYPRTQHLPWSPGRSADDLSLADVASFIGREVVVTEKMDGENTTLYRDGIHARSLESGTHPSRSWVRAMQGRIGYEIPEGWRICGENVYARHSLSYENLPGYFLAFSIWDTHNVCLPWTDTVQWCELLGIPTVPVLYQGEWDEATIRQLDGDASREGYVVRRAEGFPFASFGSAVAKYVRPNHVQTGDHWRHRAVVPNRLALPTG